MGASRGSGIIEARAFLHNDKREYLIVRRPGPDDRPWEFPGGAVKPDESPEGALRRWCQRLLNVTIVFQIGHPPLLHDFGDRVITYRFYDCKIARGEPRGGAAVEGRWVLGGQLCEYVFDEAMQKVVDWLMQHPRP